MINILLDIKPSGDAPTNNRMVQLFYGMKNNMLKLIANSDLKNSSAIIVIRLPPEKSSGYYFIDTNLAIEKKLRELFYMKLGIEEIADQIFSGTFKV